MSARHQTANTSLPPHGRSDDEKTLMLAISFAGPVARARSQNPIPSRTRPLNFSALMVLCLKTRESRSLPGLSRISLLTKDKSAQNAAQEKPSRAAFPFRRGVEQ